MSTTLDRVKSVVADRLNVSADQVTESASFQDDLGADSLGVVDLVMGLEDEFGIQIPDDDVEKMKTVSEAVQYIDEKNAE